MSITDLEDFEGCGSLPNPTPPPTTNIQWYIKDGTWWLGDYNSGVQAKGEEGLSAYEVAVRNGFVGTEQEWVDGILAGYYHSLITGNPHNTQIEDIPGLAEAISQAGKVKSVNGIEPDPDDGNIELEFDDLFNKPTTASGYGITDVYTKTEVDANVVHKSGDTMTGTLSTPALKLPLNTATPLPNELKSTDGITVSYTNTSGVKKDLAFDENVVHKTGDEIVTGNKLISSPSGLSIQDERTAFLSRVYHISRTFLLSPGTGYKAIRCLLSEVTSYANVVSMKFILGANGPANGEIQITAILTTGGFAAVNVFNKIRGAYSEIFNKVRTGSDGTYFYLIWGNSDSSWTTNASLILTEFQVMGSKTLPLPQFEIQNLASLPTTNSTVAASSIRTVSYIEDTFQKGIDEEITGFWTNVNASGLKVNDSQKIGRELWSQGVSTLTGYILITIPKVGLGQSAVFTTYRHYGWGVVPSLLKVNARLAGDGYLENIQVFFSDRSGKFDVINTGQDTDNIYIVLYGEFADRSRLVLDDGNVKALSQPSTSKVPPNVTATWSLTEPTGFTVVAPTIMTNINDSNPDGFIKLLENASPTQITEIKTLLGI